MVSLFIVTCLGLSCTFATPEVRFATLAQCKTTAPLIAGLYAGRAYEVTGQSGSRDFLFSCSSAATHGARTAGFRFATSESLLAWADGTEARPIGR